MQLAILISIVLVALLTAFLASRNDRVRKWFLSVWSALLGLTLFAAAAISSVLLSLRLPIFGVMALFGVTLVATTVTKRSINDKTGIWARVVDAIHAVAKVAFLVVFATFLLARIAISVSGYIKGD